MGTRIRVLALLSLMCSGCGINQLVKAVENLGDPAPQGDGRSVELSQCHPNQCLDAQIDWAAMNRGAELLGETFAKLNGEGKTPEKVLEWLRKQDGVERAEIDGGLIALKMKGALPFFASAVRSDPVRSRSRAAPAVPASGGGAEVFVGNPWSTGVDGERRTVGFQNTRLQHPSLTPYCTTRPIDLGSELMLAWSALAFDGVRDYSDVGASQRLRSVWAKDLPWKRAGIAGDVALEVVTQVGGSDALKAFDGLKAVVRRLRVFSAVNERLGWLKTAWHAIRCVEAVFTDEGDEWVQSVCVDSLGGDLAGMAFGYAGAWIGAVGGPWGALAGSLLGWGTGKLAAAIGSDYLDKARIGEALRNESTSPDRIGDDLRAYAEELDDNDVTIIVTNGVANYAPGRVEPGSLEPGSLEPGASSTPASRWAGQMIGSGVELHTSSDRGATGSAWTRVVLAAIRDAHPWVQPHHLAVFFRPQDDCLVLSAGEVLLHSSFFEAAYAGRGNPLEDKVIILAADGAGDRDDLARALLADTENSLVVSFVGADADAEKMMGAVGFLTSLMLRGGLSVQDAVSALAKHDREVYGMFANQGQPAPKAVFWRSGGTKRFGRPDGPNPDHNYVREIVSLHTYPRDRIPIPEEDRIVPRPGPGPMRPERGNKADRTRVDEFTLDDATLMKDGGDLKVSLVNHEEDATKAWVQVFVKIDGLRDLKSEADGEKTPNRGMGYADKVDAELLGQLGLALEIDGKAVTRWQVKSVAGGDWKRENTRLYESERLQGFTPDEAYAVMARRTEKALVKVWRAHHDSKGGPKEDQTDGVLDLWSYAFLIRAEVEKPDDGELDSILATLHLPGGGTSTHTVQGSTPRIISSKVAVADDTLLAQYQFRKASISAGRNVHGQSSLIVSRGPARDVRYEENTAWIPTGTRKLGAMTVPARSGTAPRGEPWRSVSLSRANACGVSASGSLFCAGNNRHGQLGDGSRQDAYHPGPNRVSGRWASVSVGTIHACGLKPGGSAWCWGSLPYDKGYRGGLQVPNEPLRVSTWPERPNVNGVIGSLGNSSGMADDIGPCGYYAFKDGFACVSRGSSVPVPVDGIPERLVHLDAGHATTCAVGESGALYCWGVKACAHSADCSPVVDELEAEGERLLAKIEAIGEDLAALAKRRPRPDERIASLRKARDETQQAFRDLGKKAGSVLARAWKVGDDFRFVSVGPDAWCGIKTNGLSAVLLGGMEGLA